MRAIQAYVDKYEKEVIRQSIVDRFIEAGDKFYKLAQDNAAYQNHTYDLRSSIGYLVMENGKVLAKKFETKEGSPNGEREGYELAISIGVEVSENQIALVGVAGMGYAAAVEHKGRDVITNSSGEAMKILLKAL